MLRDRHLVLWALAASAACAPAVVARADEFSYVDRTGKVHRIVLGAVTSSAGSVESYPFAVLVESAARAFALPAELLRAVMFVESGYRPTAVSATGARGLMQLMPATALELGVDDPFDPEQSIMAGARKLRLLLDTFEDNLSLALAAYNAGPQAVRRARGIPDFTETQRYVRLVLERYNLWSFEKRGTTLSESR